MGSRDFVYNLILKQDRQSFESGARSLDKVSNNISRMIGVARNAAAALGVLAAVSSAGEAKELKMANALGVSSKRLDEFKVAAKIAGTSADGLVQSMASLDQAMTDYAFGKSNPGLEKALGILSTQSGMSMNIEDLRAMDAADRIEYVLKAAQSLANKKEAASLVSDILGSAGKDFYWALETGGKSIESALAQARSVIFTDEGSKRKAFGFTTELNETLQIMKQIGLLAGSEIGGNLTPFLRDINEFLKDDKLKDKIKQFSDALSKIGEAVKPFAEGAYKTAGEVILNLADALAKMLGGDYEGVAANITAMIGSVVTQLKALWGGEKAAEAAAQAVEDAKKAGKGSVGQFLAGADAYVDNSLILKKGAQVGGTVIAVGKGILNAVAPTVNEDFALSAERQNIEAALLEAGLGSPLFGKAKKLRVDQLPFNLRNQVTAYIRAGGKKEDFKDYIQ
ncbi:MAG: hypothetical protein II814_06500, partial [Treponema sp.]|nr:hypothetical protein [Treponema sp.]